MTYFGIVYFGIQQNAKNLLGRIAWRRSLIIGLKIIPIKIAVMHNEGTHILKIYISDHSYYKTKSDDSKCTFFY